MGIRVLDPTVAEATVLSQRPAGLPSLAGRTVGLLDNGKVNVQQFLDHVEAILRSRYEVKAVVRLKKPDASRPAPPAVLAAVSGCQAVISAVGD